MAGKPGRAGRHKAEGPPMSYADWKKLGRPPLLLSVRHVAEWCRLTVMAVNNHIKAGRLFRYDDGPNKSKIPTDHPGNQKWLKEREDYTPNEFKNSVVGRPAKDPANPKSSTPRSYAAVIPSPPRPPTSLPDDEGYTPPAAGEDMLDVEELLEALRTADYSKISAAAVQKLARIETALKTRVDREAKRGLLIDRTLVTAVFAKLYQTDSNELRTVAAKVTPDVCAELGIEDPETILKIEKCIDDEILKALAHRKRIMDDFLVGVGGEPVPTE